MTECLSPYAPNENRLNRRIRSLSIGGMALKVTSSKPVLTAMVLAVVALVGGWQWWAGRGLRAGVPVVNGPAEVVRLAGSAPLPTTDGSPAPVAGPGLSSTQKQFAEIQKSLPKPEVLPVALPAEENEGMVRSPYAPDQGYVDVSGLPSGTKVRCPYTNKVFLVP
jgi:hypothetical protein